MNRFLRYMITPFDKLPWWHTLTWGTVLGFALGTLAGLVFSLL